MLVEIEPRFNLSFIDIIFGDQGLTDQILIDLDIGSTCILRGDYHHLINEVWPHTFGTHLYQKIHGHLDRMLLGSKSEWELSYTSAKQHLLHDAENSQPWNKSTTNHLTLLGGSSKRLRATFFFMDPSLQNKTILAWQLILVLVQVGLLRSK
jgi:hypothetical protein